MTRKEMIFNVLTISVVVLFAVAVIMFFTIFVNPASGVNPFPPSTLPAMVVLPSATATKPVVFPPTWTPAPTQTLANSSTNEIATPRPGETVIAQPTASQEPTMEGGYPFQVQGEPEGMKSTIFNPNSTCAWMGVAGRVNDLQDRPYVGAMIRLGGTINYQPIQEQYTLAGMATNYGASGFEFTISNTLIASKQTLWIQLVDQARVPLSDKIYFDTYADCEENLILINFRQVR